MHITLKEVLAVAAAGYLFCKNWWDRISPILTPLVQDVEQKALDGKIDASDRKAIAMDMLAKLQSNGTIKLSYLQNLLASAVINALAQRLPDWETTKAIKDGIAK
jgi:hypothetical protein